jgi:hypothetical protein
LAVEALAEQRQGQTDRGRGGGGKKGERGFDALGLGVEQGNETTAATLH